MKKNSSMKIALCGMTGALCITFLLMGFLFPFATYASPAAAACLLMPIVYEYRQKTAFTLYIAVSFLAFMLVPETEAVFMFIFVFGLYTVLKFSIDKIKSKPLRYFAKFVYINLSLAVSYGLLLIVFPVAVLVNEFAGYTMGFMILLVILFNITFFIYDKAVEKVLIIYVYRLRPKLFHR